MSKRNLKVFSMSFLDLLCCGLGAVILLNLLMIVSIRRQAAGAIDYTYFIVDADIWIEIPASRRVAKKQLPDFNEQFVEEAVSDGTLEKLSENLFQVKRLSAIITPDAFDAESFDDQLPVSLTVRYLAKPSDSKVKTFDFQRSGVIPFQSSELQFSRDESSPSSFYLWNRKWYYRVQLNSWAMHVPEGIFSFELAFRSNASGNNFMAGETILDRHLCRIELQGSGIGGHQVIQSHKAFPVDREITIGREEGRIFDATRAWEALRATPKDDELLTSLLRARIPFQVNQGLLVDSQPELKFHLSRTTGSTKFGVIASPEKDPIELLENVNILFPSSKFDSYGHDGHSSYFPSLYVTSGRK
jgi:hypothetical protein